MPPLVAHASFNEVTEGNEQFRTHFLASHTGNLGSPRAKFYRNAVQMTNRTERTIFILSSQV